MPPKDARIEMHSATITENSFKNMGMKVNKEPIRDFKTIFKGRSRRLRPKSHILDDLYDVWATLWPYKGPLWLRVGDFKIVMG